MNHKFRVIPKEEIEKIRYQLKSELEFFDRRI